MAICVKMDDCHKIKMIRNHDLLEQQYAEAVEEVCAKCPDKEETAAVAIATDRAPIKAKIEPGGKEQWVGLYCGNSYTASVWGIPDNIQRTEHGYTITIRVGGHIAGFMHVDSYEYKGRS